LLCGLGAGVGGGGWVWVWVFVGVDVCVCVCVCVRVCVRECANVYVYDMTHSHASYMTHSCMWHMTHSYVCDITGILEASLSSPANCTRRGGGRGGERENGNLNSNLNLLNESKSGGMVWDRWFEWRNTCKVFFVPDRYLNTMKYVIDSCKKYKKYFTRWQFFFGFWKVLGHNETSCETLLWDKQKRNCVHINEHDGVFGVPERCSNTMKHWVRPKHKSESVSKLTNAMKHLLSQRVSLKIYRPSIHQHAHIWHNMSRRTHDKSHSAV